MEDNSLKVAVLLGPIFKEGGVTTFIEELVRIISTQGYLIYVVTFTRKETSSARVLNSDTNYVKVFFLPQDICKLILHIHTKKIRVVISNLYYSSILPFLRSQNKIHILHGWGKPEVGLLKFIVANISNILGYRFANRVISNSYLTSSVNRLFGINNSEVHPWGIPNGFQSSLIKSNLERDIDLLYVGRLTTGKGIETIVKAFQDVCKKDFHKITLHIVGDLTHSLEFQKHLEKFALPDSIKYHGFLDKDKLVDIYSRAKLFISLHSDEPFGFTYLEALASGTPIIIPKGCGIAPFLNNDMALFIDINEISITQAIQYGLSSYWDNEKIAYLARSHFSWQNLAQTLLKD